MLVPTGENGTALIILSSIRINPENVESCLTYQPNTKGVCLNDMLMKGPDLVTNLIDILLRFRQHRVAAVADVEKMFHQVRVRPSDGPAFRSIWHDPGSTQPPDVYQMDVHLFGAV